ncbi:MAG: hypothetical protein WCW35_02350 [Bacteroidota bacterium]|jgi:hypothetical protein
MKRSFPFFIASSVLLLFIVAEFVSILKINSGTFVYTLDDAYIHLSVAESIANGGYGINPGEFSSPSSSILWPFLLAPFTFFSFVVYVPLLLNIFCSFGTLFFSWKILETVFHDIENKSFIVLLLSILSIAATGMVPLIFSGMEHSLQIMTVVIVLFVMVQELRGVFDPRAVVFAIILASTVRYENLSICLFAISFFFVRGRIRSTLHALAGVAGIHLLFSLFLWYNDASFLPTSVLLKTNSLQSSMVSIPKFVGTVNSYFGGFYFAVAVFSIGYYFLKTRTEPFAILGLGSAFIILLHLLNGYTQPLGDFSTDLAYSFRYEMYMWIFALLVLMISGKSVIRSVVRFSPAFAAVVLVGAEMFFCARVNSAIFTVPTAANNIYEQHYQNHRLLTEFYIGPAAVNDIGYAAFQNDEVILDLWGLASRDAWKLRIANPLKTEWIDSIVISKGITFAILYDVWFPFLPPTWTKVGELTLTKREVTASENVVSYYAVRTDAVHQVTDAMKLWQKTLPLQSMLIFTDSVTAPATDSTAARR